MPTVLERLPQGARVAVVRLRSLGDCVLSTPAIHILKQARPDLRVAVAVENVFRAVFEGNPDIDELLPPLALAVRKWRPWLCWNLHGGTASVRITAVSGARLRAGFAHFRYRFLYNVRIPRAQEILGEERKVHTAEHAASAVFYFGAPRVEIPRARLFAPPAAPSRPYAVIHPIASAPAKTWSAAGFMAVAAHLERAHGMEPVFVAGGGEDVSAFTTHRCMVGAPLGKVKALHRGGVAVRGQRFRTGAHGGGFRRPAGGDLRRFRRGCVAAVARHRGGGGARAGGHRRGDGSAGYRGAGKAEGAGMSFLTLVGQAPGLRRPLRPPERRRAESSPQLKDLPHMALPGSTAVLKCGPPRLVSISASSAPEPGATVDARRTQPDTVFLCVSAPLRQKRLPRRPLSLGVSAPRRSIWLRLCRAVSPRLGGQLWMALP